MHVLGIVADMPVWVAADEGVFKGEAVGWEGCGEGIGAEASVIFVLDKGEGLCWSWGNEWGTNCDCYTG